MKLTETVAGHLFSRQAARYRFFAETLHRHFLLGIRFPCVRYQLSYVTSKKSIEKPRVLFVKTKLSIGFNMSAQWRGWCFVNYVTAKRVYKNPEYLLNQNFHWFNMSGTTAV